MLKNAHLKGRIEEFIADMRDLSGKLFCSGAVKSEEATSPASTTPTEDSSKDDIESQEASGASAQACAVGYEDGGASDSGADADDDDVCLTEVEKNSSAESETRPRKKYLRGRRAIVAAVLAVSCLIVFLLVSPGSILQRMGYLITGEYKTSAGVYQGEMDNWHFSGQGTFIFNSGEVYKGAWKAGVMDGAGAFQYPSVGTYKGDYKNGHRDGTGTFTWDNGDSYTGEWDSDEMDGKGTYRFASGLSIKGEFAGNKYESGVINLEDESRAIEIEYKDGSPSKISVRDEAKRREYSFVGDFGEKFITDGSLTITDDEGEYRFTVDNSEINKLEASFVDGTSYTGGYSDKGLDGSGTLTDASGNKYVGSFAGGVKSGKGTMTWSDGASYDGEWSDDTMNGRGEYRYAPGSAGSRLVGTFENGNPNGECTWYQNDAKSYKTVWENGKCVKVIE